MDDGIDFEILENEAIDGRIFLQFFSGDVLNRQCKIDCLNRLCNLEGRMKLSKGNHVLWNNYSFSLEMAREFSVGLVENNDPAVVVPAGVDAKRIMKVEAWDFPYHLPVDKLEITVISGTYEAPSPFLSHESSKQVCLLKVTVQFKPLELVTRPASLASYTIEEVVFDKLAILRGRLSLPRPFAQNDVYLEVGSPTPSHQHVYRSPRSLNSPEYNNKKSHTPSRGASTMNWLRRMSSLAIEFFVLFVVILLWLIVRSHYLTEDNYQRFTLYSIVFIFAVTLVIFSFRGTLLKTLLKQLAPPECNGRTFFVNGWNTWSFCGTVLQGHPPPIYSMPSMFVKAFHDGGVGTALHINLGYGEAPEFQSATSNNKPSRDAAKKTVEKNLFDEEMRLPDNKYEEESNTQSMPAPFIITTGSNSINEDQTLANRFNIPSINTAPVVTPAVDIVTNVRDYQLAAKDYVASDMFTTIADTRSKCGLVIGFLSQHQQFGCIAVNKNYDRVSVHVSGDGVLVSNASITTDWLCLYTINTLEAPFKVYMSISSRANNVQRHAVSPNVSPHTVQQAQFNHYPPFSPSSHTEATSHFSTILRHTSTSSTNTTTVPAGWCSWYHYYDKISEQVLLQNLSSMTHLTHTHYLDSARQAFKLFQIDDGYQAAWGDWTTLDKSKFPAQSMQALVNQIKKAHFTPGLWLAPFSCDKHSQLAKLHPDWIIKRNHSANTPANSANCGKFFYGLDTTHPEVQAHLKETFTTAASIWGFEYLKLDFLYSAVLGNAHDSHYDRTLTNAQIMQRAMRLVRESVGEKVFLLGCGAPMGSLIGHVDANRVSADAGLCWHPEFPLPRSDKWNLPCARNCVRNTLTRLFMHQHWWTNDPDCLLLRDKLHFTLDEIRGIATSKALSGGSFILSDDLNAVSSERLRIALQLLPPAPIAAVAIDLLERETPELFRMQLRSNFAHNALFHAGDVGEADLSCLNMPVISLNTHHNNNHNIHKNTDCISAPVTPEKPPLRLYGDVYPYIDSTASSPTNKRTTHPSNTFNNTFSTTSGAHQVSTSLAGTHFYTTHNMSPPRSPTGASHTSTNTSNTTTENNNKPISRATLGSLSLSLSRCGSPQRPAPLSKDPMNNLYHNAIHNMGSNAPDSPRISRKHSFEKGLILRAGSDLNLLRKQRRKVKEILREENAINEDDLLGEYTLFSACNWSDVPKKDHFVSLRQIFGVEYIAQLVARGVLFENLLRLQQAAAAQKIDKVRRDRSFPKAGVERAQRGNSQLSDTPRYLLHLFNFWTEQYSYRVVTLEGEEDCEVALLNIPAHSAHIYSVSLTTDPTLPKYVGSNLHFTCGTEIHRIYLTAVPEQADSYLKSVFFGQEYTPSFDAFSPGNTDADCAFADGFGPADMDTLFDDPRPQQEQQHHSALNGGSTVHPVVRTMCVSFEEGALRDANWGGYIWVFLPVNGLNPPMTNGSFGHIHVTGSAVESLYPSSHLASSSSSQKGISSQRAQEAPVLLATHVRAPDCRIYGDVYRIAVCRSNHTAAAGSGDKSRNGSAQYCQVSPLPLSRTHSNPDVLHHLSPRVGSEKDKDFVVISWVYDVREDGDITK